MNTSASLLNQRLGKEVWFQTCKAISTADPQNPQFRP